MKRNEDYILRTIAGESILVPTGKASQEFNGMIHLTDTAAFIWENINSCKNLEELVQKILKEYDVDEETARRDVHGFTSALYTHGLLTDVPEFEHPFDEDNPSDSEDQKNGK